MPYPNIPYKSYCWSFGTTSFRTKNFSFMIETQLKLLSEFWDLPENKEQSWDGNVSVQTAYYEFLKKNSFINGEAPNKAKDAREKTSGLVDIGLITATRKITEVGKLLLAISSSQDFTSDNLLGIDRDSFIYLKQMLKTSNQVDSTHVRPFIVLIYLLSKLEYLTTEETTFLLPLCVDENSTQLICDLIPELRNNKVNVDSIIIQTLLSMENYKTACDLFLKNKVSKELVMTIGMNRKSRAYDAPYYALYLALQKVFIKKDKTAISTLYNAIGKIKLAKYWRGLLFSTSSAKAITKNPQGSLQKTNFNDVKNEKELKTIFFSYMHLFKSKATLSDYFDLNRRYIKNTDIILFQDNIVKFDILPKQLFTSIADTLYKQAYLENNDLTKDISLIEIDSSMDFTPDDLIVAVNTELGISVTSLGDAKQAIENERYVRLNKLIDERFTDDQLITLLTYIENRLDSQINEYVTDNADIPTIFEYLLGIIWYKISEREGKLLDYMKLSLEADLLPKTHAGGGEADIVYEYKANDIYPEHAVLLEATLANASTQRSMEMEPVSRHLGQHLLKTGNLNSYCVFTSNYLNINVISDFRNRKTTAWYDTQDHSKYVNGMKIIPLQTSELKNIIQNKVKYKELYTKLEEAYQSDLPPHEWYEACVRNV